LRAFFVLLCTALLCGGCAFTTDTIDVPYQPLAAAAPIAGAPGIAVTVTGTDGRTTDSDRVGTKKNGYGQECAPILSSNDIPTTVAGAFSQELSERGFKIGPGGVTLKIEVVQFYNDFKTGFFAAHAVSNVAFNTEIVAPDGAIAFSKYYQGTGDNPNVQLMGGSEARAALIKAFQSAVASAVNDPDFIHGLIAAGAKAPQT
jgi:uncharacterized lipoprotein